MFLVGGVANDNDFSFLEFDGQGAPITTLGSGGYVITDIDGRIDNLDNLTVQPGSGGKIVAIGSTDNLSSTNALMSTTRYLP